MYVPGISIANQPCYGQQLIYSISANEKYGQFNIPLIKHSPSHIIVQYYLDIEYCIIYNGYFNQLQVRLYVNKKRFFCVKL